VDISFVIISYNDDFNLLRAVGSAALKCARERLKPEIWVVDNGSTDYTPWVLSQLGQVLGERLKVIRLPRNMGTTRPRNLALARAAGRVVCVMDSDAALARGSLRGVMSLVEGCPSVGIVGPRIVVPGRGVYDSAKMVPTLVDKMLKLPRILMGLPAPNRDWYTEFPFHRPTPVHTVISCCWVFRREVFRRIGPLDERIFYAPEDVDWCLRAWKAGLGVVYYPYLSVIHHTRQITHRMPISPVAFSHMKGLGYYWLKHRYLLSRRHVVRHYIEPTLPRVQHELRAWEARIEVVA